ncbi:MrcB family domain-containing protein [Erythrobacter neustonensis]|uniref:Protein NO VEIN C-terminal domain-containing protein n=1 Tax=Erythrobacter neustonensis TaxID=1112 RepID=A0A192D4E3_9SPHN|nr:DUF3578 domain-containing protein [Erythrobacter neustonensis]ANK12762.1 hypothetical protein A9D12_07190 [Erythrobacter neustonensis]
MQEMLREVLELQLDFSSENTPAMERRGQLVRNMMPEELRRWRAVTGSAVLPFKGRLNVQGKDGTGRKTFVPWIRVHSPELSPSAQKGWYVVFLFHANGDGVSLCVSHGSTSFNGRDFVPRSDEEVAELMSWARGLLGKQAGLLGFREGVDLGSNFGLSGPYERTTAFSKFYPVEILPGDEQLQKDLEQAVGLLGQLYHAIELGRAPEAVAPDIQEAQLQLEAIASPRRSNSRGGQGFGLSAAQRKVVEDQAMHLAKGWLKANGYDDIQDVSATQSCDFTASRGGVEHVVEVKGTTAGFGTILLTANEVELHRVNNPHNVLIVVHSIDLLEMRTQAAGGIVTAIEGWEVDKAELRPLSYCCNL